MVMTELSLKVPVAVNCCELPKLIDGLAGATVMDCNVAFVTVRVAVPLWPTKAAEMVVLPGATPVARPLVADALLTVATEDEDEVHVTADVRLRLCPSAKFPVALS